MGKSANVYLQQPQAQTNRVHTSWNTPCIKEWHIFVSTKAQHGKLTELQQDYTAVSVAYITHSYKPQSQHSGY